MQVHALVEHGVDQCQPHGAAEIARQVEEAGGVFHPLRRHRPERQVIDRNETHDERATAQDLRNEQLVKVPVLGDVGGLPGAERKAAEAEGDENARVYLGRQPAHDGRGDELAKAGDK